MKKRATSIYPKRKWSEEDISFLKENYSSMSMPGLMDQLIRTDLAIHKMAGLLNITGNRYNVNNYAVGASYKNRSGQKPRTRVAKNVKVNTFSIVTAFSKKKKPQRQRWCDNKLEVKPFNAAGKVLVRVDHRTCVYVPETATQSEIEIIIQRFKKVS